MGSTRPGTAPIVAVSVSRSTQKRLVRDVTAHDGPSMILVTIVRSAASGAPFLLAPRPRVDPPTERPNQSLVPRGKGGDDRLVACIMRAAFWVGALPESGLSEPVRGPEGTDRTKLSVGRSDPRALGGHPASECGGRRRSRALEPSASKSGTLTQIS